MDITLNKLRVEDTITTKVRQEIFESCEINIRLNNILLGNICI